MELRKLNVDERFEFEDKRTSLPLAGNDKGFQFPPKGVFRFLGTAQWGWLKLIHEESNTGIIVIAEVGLRHVLPIF